jgi:hypothetical protein
MARFNPNPVDKTPGQENVPAPVIFIVDKDPPVPVTLDPVELPPFRVRFRVTFIVNAPEKVVLSTPVVGLIVKSAVVQLSASAIVGFTFVAIVQRASSLGHCLPLLVRVAVPFPLTIIEAVPKTFIPEERVTA